MWLWGLTVLMQDSALFRSEREVTGEMLLEEHRKVYDPTFPTVPAIMFLKTTELENVLVFTNYCYESFHSPHTL